MNGQTSQTAILQDILSYTSQWIFKFFFTPTQLASFSGGTIIPLSIQFRSGRTLLSSQTFPINMNGNSNWLNMTYNSVNQRLSGPTIATLAYNSVSNPLVTTGADGSMYLFVTLEKLGGCPTGTPVTCSDGTNIAASRNQYCQKLAEYYSVCVQKTTEDVACRVSEFQLAVSGVAFIDTVDVSVLSCSTTCGPTGAVGTAVRYNVTIYAPEQETLDSRMSNLDKSFNTQTFPGFTVNSFIKSDGLSRIPTFILVITLLIMCIVA
jgi:hypothetical protein